MSRIKEFVRGMIIMLIILSGSFWGTYAVFDMFNLWCKVSYWIYPIIATTIAVVFFWIMGAFRGGFDQMKINRTKERVLWIGLVLILSLVILYEPSEERERRGVLYADLVISYYNDQFEKLGPDIMINGQKALFATTQITQLSQQTVNVTFPPIYFNLTLTGTPGKPIEKDLRVILVKIPNAIIEAENIQRETVSLVITGAYKHLDDPVYKIYGSAWCSGDMNATLSAFTYENLTATRVRATLQKELQLYIDFYSVYRQIQDYPVRFQFQVYATAVDIGTKMKIQSTPIVAWQDITRPPKKEV